MTIPMLMDSLDVDAPAAVEEVALLRTFKVGQTRTGQLFPAIPEPLVWTCQVSEETRWEFVGTFGDQHVARLEIVLTPLKLSLYVQEAD